MSGATDERAARLAQLRRRYLDEIVREVVRLADTLPSQDADDPRGELRRRLHSLRGSGGAYGFPSITEAAARAEAACRAGDGVDTLRARLVDLADCAAAARAGLAAEATAPAPAAGRPS